MRVELVSYKPIGVVHSPHKKRADAPRRPYEENPEAGTVEIFPEYAGGLKDLDGFSHIILLCHFHLTGEAKMEVIPPIDGKLHGVFATRSPTRPNPIGLSIVRLIKVEGNMLHISCHDIVDGTPLLDIKPYTSRDEPTTDIRVGWLEKIQPNCS